MSENEQLNLFGEEYAPAPDPKKDKKKEASSATKSSKTGSPTVAKSTKDQNIEVEPDFTIHYATRTFVITDFIQEIPESGKVTLKQLREVMEGEFFEMTEQRTLWDYDLERKRLMPYVSGTTKGMK